MCAKGKIKDLQSEDISFESAMKKLEELVSKMEAGKLPLEDMMKHFEEGNKLAEICSRKLKEIERKIEILVNKEGGEEKWKDFESENKETPAANRNTPKDEEDKLL
ncbi:MAG TPA: exodeoxyribonuclease VII small subunit [Victivallales bacterium]|nr:exodeoxyribonuclease VII small subunit [Victivallales bacterium]